MNIIKIAKNARKNESKKEIEEAFENWFEVSNLIDMFEEKYILTEKITWAEKTAKKYFTKEILISAILGLIIGILANFIFKFF